MSVTGQILSPPHVALRVRHEDTEYPAEVCAKGAAYEIFAAGPGPGFLPNPRPGAALPFRRFVPACDTSVVAGPAPVPADPPLTVPLSRGVSWAAVHQLSQSHPGAGDDLLARVRASARIHRGTRMVKVLSGAQLAGHLRGWLPQGFCYRECDIAHLRTPADLAILRADGDDTDGGQVVFALRWRALDPQDFEIPDLDGYAGLVRMPPHDRVGPPVLGTGFAPSGQQLIPEFVTADLADLPYPAFAELLAYPPDGTEVMLYTFLPEQRTWARLAGPQWRHVFGTVPGIDPAQEYFPIPAAPSQLVGRYRDAEYEAVADPPGEFRVLAKTRAARYPVRTLTRRTPRGTWRGVPGTIVRVERDWLRLRLIRPSRDAVLATAAGCVERGVYEVWAPVSEVTAAAPIEIHYQLPDQSQ